MITRLFPIFQQSSAFKKLFCYIDVIWVGAVVYMYGGQKPSCGGQLHTDYSNNILGIIVQGIFVFIYIQVLLQKLYYSVSCLNPTFAHRSRVGWIQSTTYWQSQICLKYLFHGSLQLFVTETLINGRHITWIKFVSNIVISFSWMVAIILDGLFNSQNLYIMHL